MFEPPCDPAGSKIHDKSFASAQKATSNPNFTVPKGRIDLVIRTKVGPSARMVRGTTPGDVSWAIMGPVWDNLDDHKAPG